MAKDTKKPTMKGGAGSGVGRLQKAGTPVPKGDKK